MVAVHFIIYGIVLIVLAWIILFNTPYQGICQKCHQEGRKTKIWLWQFPGYSAWYRPEHTIALKDWLGSKYIDLKAVSIKAGSEIPEVTAGLALKAAGIADEGYKFKKDAAGHWLLQSSSKQGRVFDLAAVHQIKKCPFGHRNH